MSDHSPYVHPRAICESPNIGESTKIWAFAHILPGAVIGKDCNICDGVFIENNVIIGDRVTIKCGVQVWDGIILEDDVFVGPNATFTNDRFPRSKAYLDRYPETRICQGSSIGANATILPGINIGSNAMVGAGAVVTRSVPPNAIVMGNPARITGYINADDSVSVGKSQDTLSVPDRTVFNTRVSGVTLHNLPLIVDPRGSLSVGEVGDHLPFPVERYFVVFDVPSIDTRGEHAHRECHQFLICVSGSLAVVVDDGLHRQEIILDRPNLGIYLPPLTWGIQYKYSSDAVLLVFASHHYSPGDYIRNYDEFLNVVRQ